jgi:hypothetical protein
MVMSRVIALMMISASAAAQAQQQPAAAQQTPPPPTATKADKVCRIHMELNIPRRVCMTKEQWAQVDAEQNASNRGGAGYDRQRCNTSTTLGAC